MLDELQRRNYAKTTVQYYIQAVERFAKHFHRAPDQLNQTHLRELLALDETEDVALSWHARRLARRQADHAESSGMRVRPRRRARTFRSVCQHTCWFQRRYHRLDARTTYIACSCCD